MKLLPILATLAENTTFSNNIHCQESLEMTLDFYKIIGFSPPWICYYVEVNDEIVGTAAFKGKPINHTVEIAYGTFELYRQKGIGTEICKQLLMLAQRTDPFLKIIARTLPEENFSTKLLRKNHFVWSGVVNDPEDGDIWEWVFEGKDLYA